MTTLSCLKAALREHATKVQISPSRPLSDMEYSDGFEIIVKGSGSIYRDFIVQELSRSFSTLNAGVSVLEIGPGPKSIIGCLSRQLRGIVRKYTAFEPNKIFAAQLKNWLCHTSEGDFPLPCLQDGYNVHERAFSLPNDLDTRGGNDDEVFDMILYCHSLYGMNPKRDFIERSLNMLVDKPRTGLLVVFHRDDITCLDGLLCHQRSALLTGTILIPDTNTILDAFASFVAGFVAQNHETQKILQVEWRAVCRTLGHHEQSGFLSFSSPEVMMAFTKRSTTLPELAMQVPFLTGARTVKNKEARRHRPAAVVVPKNVEDIQKCVRWAIIQNFSLTVIGGGHSGHCLWPNVVAVDMSRFNQLYVHVAKNHVSELESDHYPRVVVGTGCNTEDIIRRTMAEGLTVPLGSRPSVGAGLWLQGGIGHLTRMCGLSCDAIIGAVMVCLKTSQIIGVGHVPSEHWPLGTVRPRNEADILWALKGAGTNIGIVISVVFKAYPAPTYAVRDWNLTLTEPLEVQKELCQLDYLTSKLPRHCSADAYLYYDDGELRLGVSSFELIDAGSSSATPSCLENNLGPPNSDRLVDGIGLFDCEMYVSGMHGGHVNGKTSSFKRCLFFEKIGQSKVSKILATALEGCPSSLSYVHLLHGGGAVKDIAMEATAFGSREWEYACIITGVWPRAQADISCEVIQWVYDIANSLLPFCAGVYPMGVNTSGPNAFRVFCLSIAPHGRRGHPMHLISVAQCI